MRIILIVLIPFLVGLIPANSPDLGEQASAYTSYANTVPVDAHVSMITEEFCDHKTNGDFPIQGLTARLTELGSGTVYEDVSDSNGDFTLCKPVDGPISYEGILPLRYYTDAIISNPRFGVSIFDAVLISRYAAGLDNLCSYTRFAADVNQDGRITPEDATAIQQFIIFASGVTSNPYPFDLWRLVPKLPTISGYFHPDQQFLADFWNNALVTNSVGLYPFVAELNLQNDVYVYQNGSCHFVDDKIKEWEYRDDVDGCSPNSFDFYLGKIGDMNGSVNGDFLDGTSSDKFGIRCSTSDDEAYLGVIPYGNGFVGVGYAVSANPANGRDVLVVRMNQYGEPIWSKTYGGTGADLGRTVVEASDGNLFITGRTESVSAARQDIYVLKINASTGAVMWENVIEGNDQNNIFPGIVSYGIETTDGGFILGSRTGNFGQGWLDMYIVKLNNLGNLDWSKTYGGNNNDWSSGIIQTQDGGYLVTGHSSSFDFGFHDILLLKLDAQGNISWQKHMGTTDNDRSGEAIELANGHFILTGSYGAGNTYNTTVSKAVVLELDANGNIIWSMGYTGSGKDVAYKAMPVSGGYLILGRTTSFDGPGVNDAMLFKIDTLGVLDWTRQYGETGKDDELYTIHKYGSNEYIMGGATLFPGQDRDVWYQRVNEAGDIYPYVCFQKENALASDAVSTSIANSNAIVNTVSSVFSINSTSQDFEMSCYKVCVTTGGGASVTDGSNNSFQLKINDRQLETVVGKTQKARVSIRSKIPIEGFGFGMSIDHSFAIKNIRTLGKGLPMNITISKAEADLSKGEIRVMGLIDFSNDCKPAVCSNATPVFEIEGVFTDVISKDVIALNKTLLKAEFIANQQVLAPEEYEIIIDWIN